MAVRFTTLQAALVDNYVWSAGSLFYVNPVHVVSVAQVDKAELDGLPVSFVKVVDGSGYYVVGGQADLVKKLA